MSVLLPAFRSSKLRLWTVSLLASLLLHNYLYRSANEAISVLPREQPGSANEQVILLKNVQEENEEPELQFDPAPELAPPEVSTQSSALVAPDSFVDLGLDAAAGGTPGGLGIDALAIPLAASSGNGLAGFGSATGIGESRSPDSFAAYIEGLSSTGLDVVFVVDATGSMDWVIAEVTARIADIVDIVRGLVPVSRFGIVAYRDFNDPEFVARILPLTFSQLKLAEFLASIEAKGGDSYQEAVSAGLNLAERESNWRPGSRRTVILIGDAPPHQENMPSILAIARRVAEKSGQLSTLDVSQDSNPALIEASVGRAVNKALYRNSPMLDYQAIADAGNGLAATMDGDIRVTRQLLNLIMGGQFSTEMSLLMDGL